MDHPAAQPGFSGLGRSIPPTLWTKDVRPAADRGMGFGDFRVLPAARTLLFQGSIVALGSRAFDLLVVLLRSRGNVVAKDEIVRQVWPSTFVDESNLRFQMGMLRKALGPERDRIKTIPGRGYLFAAGDDNPADLAPPSPDAAVAGHRDREEPDEAAGKMAITIIDSNTESRDTMSALLRAFDLTVISFESVEAFSASEPAPAPACMILDAWLSGRSGLDFQKDLAAQGMRLPIIFVSGHADVPMAVRAMKAGALDFLTKPVRHQDLIDAVNTAIAAARRDEAAKDAGLYRTVAAPGFEARC